MPKTRELTIAERSQIVLLSTLGWSQVAIAKKMICSRCAVQFTLKRYKETGSYENKPKTGQRRCTSERDDRILKRMAIRNRRKSSKELNSELWTHHGVSISSVTVRRRLKEVNLHGRVARRKPYLTAEHKKKRLNWARKYENWTIQEWSRLFGRIKHRGVFLNTLIYFISNSKSSSYNALHLHEGK